MVAWCYGVEWACGVIPYMAIRLYLGKITPSIAVNPVLSGHSKLDKTKVLMTNGSLMKFESIAECSPWSILQYF